MNGKIKWRESLAAILRVGIGYLRAMLIFFCINLVVMTICFFAFNVPLPPLVAFGISVLDILPVIGSGIVFVPWAVICWVTGNTVLGIQLALLYIGLVVLRQVLEPFVVGKHIGVRPLVTLVSSILGLFAFGAAGFIIGPVIAAVFNAVYRVHAKDEANS